MGSFPQIADWNEDGKKDLIVADTFGKLNLFLNVGENDAPVLQNSGRIGVDGGDLNIGAQLCVELVDWNNDGKKDILAGSNRQLVYLYTNIGTNESPVYSKTHRQQLWCGSSQISHMFTSPQVHDMNNDGKKDLVVGSSDYGLYYYMNVGTDAEPVFENEEKLKADDEYILVSRYPRFDIYDWNEDGYPDIIMGEKNGSITLFLNKGDTSPVEEPPTPDIFVLHQNYPNPFNPVTTIKINLRKAGQVSLKIYNSKGQQVRTLVSGYLQIGETKFKWYGNDESGNKVASGVYFYRFETDKFSKTKKMILIR